jgi:hypothetical protein
MDILVLLVWLALIGFAAWALTNFIPMDGRIAAGIQILAFIICVLIVLQAFGLLHSLGTVPRLR